MERDTFIFTLKSSVVIRVNLFFVVSSSSLVVQGISSFYNFQGSVEFYSIPLCLFVCVCVILFVCTYKRVCNYCLFMLHYSNVQEAECQTAVLIISKLIVQNVQDFIASCY